MRKRMYICAACLLFLCLALSSAPAQQVFKTTPTSVIGYLEYVPEGYNTDSDKYPIVIFLHGIGERGVNSTDPATLSTTIQNVAKLGPPMYVKSGTQFPFILISPQLKSNYGKWPASYVMEVINHVKTYLRVDERRIYLTGLSLGGGGVWMTAQEFPEFFAAIAPVCGGYNTLSQACSIGNENLPVWAFHGDADGTVPLSRSVNMVNAINACTPKPSPLAKMTVYPGVGHSAWTKAYKNDNTVHTPNVYQWMTSFTNTVNNGNKIPVASAGADLSVKLPLSAVITGSGTDADGSIASYTWTQISGPSTATLVNKLTKVLTASALLSGTYVFRLTVKDNSGNTDSDYVKVTVGAGAENVLPVANAGTDKTITLPVNAVAVSGSGTDADGTIATYAWSKVSGSTVALSGASTQNLQASGMVEGAYVFRLTVTDNKGAKKSDDMTVTVKAVPASGLSANAGKDQVISLPATSLYIYGGGTATPGRIIRYYKWTKVSGPGNSLNYVSKPTLYVYNMHAGVYVFKLTVTDDEGATSTDQVQVTVKDAVASATLPVAPASLRISPAATDKTAEDQATETSENQTAILGNLTRAQLRNSTVVIFSDSGERIYSGTWDSETYREVLNKSGLYIYNVIREGKRMETGKIYIRG